MMKLTTALGVALASLTVAAYADSSGPNVVIRQVGPGLHHGGGDADNDGWITRAEASAGAARMFDEMDANDDGRLTSEDHAGRHEHMRAGHGPDGVHVMGINEDNCERTSEGEGDDRRVTVICRETGDGERRTERTVTIVRNGEQLDEAEIQRIEREAERVAREAERAARHAERRARSAARDADDAARETERRVVVVTGGPDGAWVDGVPMPPMPPLAPMIMMMHGGGEADLDGDGALSRDEFVAQHLRFFDAQDANRDGRIEVPRPPQPPAPPAPPESPRRR